MNPRKRVLLSDYSLGKLMQRLRFVEDPTLADRHPHHVANRLAMIVRFVENYEDTDQETVEFAAEAFVVVRSILSGLRPVKLEFLTDFEGELRGSPHPKQEL